MRMSPIFTSFLLSGLLFALSGCGSPPPAPSVPLTPLQGAPDGSAEVLRVDAADLNTIGHETGSFLEFANEPDRVVLVDFWAPWCRPCVQMVPELESIARQFPNEVSVVKVDVDENANSAIARYFDVSAIPDLRVFVNGKPVEHIAGYRSSRQFIDILSPHIATLK